MARAMSTGGGAAVPLGLLLALCCAAAAVHGKDWMVGDDDGWGFGLASHGWGRDKPIAVGDYLVFKYNKDDHNVVELGADSEGYRLCKPGNNSKTHNSGEDRIRMTSRARVYFICGIEDHCKQMLKIGITPR